MRTNKTCVLSLTVSRRYSPGYHYFYVCLVFFWCGCRCCVFVASCMLLFLLNITVLSYSLHDILIYVILSKIDGKDIFLNNIINFLTVSYANHYRDSFFSSCVYTLYIHQCSAKRAWVCFTAPCLL